MVLAAFTVIQASSLAEGGVESSSTLPSSETSRSLTASASEVVSATSFERPLLISARQYTIFDLAVYSDIVLFLDSF